ncbi:MAG TPA: hypothetical protein VLL97_02290, partial [Acidobacteriota bacterium]|nr:hypothetical protein [Acidobacteriota bacterium]
MITRRQFSRLGLGLAALSSCAGTLFGSGRNGPTTTVLPPKEGERLRRTGVRVNGSYWGAGGEQIDMLSGNLCFSLPLLTASGREMKASMACSYNSQLWEQHNSRFHEHGADAGYGYGWRAQFGAVVPHAENGVIRGYTYIDASGAEYPLSFSRGVWVSLQGLYISYCPLEMRLQFPDGTFWILGCRSVPGEHDSGAQYPTLIQDANGNQVLIRYMAGSGTDKTNTSGRIQEIQDPRAVMTATGRKSYVFIYDASP